MAGSLSTAIDLALKAWVREVRAGWLRTELFERVVGRGAQTVHRQFHARDLGECEVSSGPQVVETASRCSSPPLGGWQPGTSRIRTGRSIPVWTVAQRSIASRLTGSSGGAPSWPTSTPCRCSRRPSGSPRSRPRRSSGGSCRGSWRSGRSERRTRGSPSDFRSDRVGVGAAKRCVHTHTHTHTNSCPDPTS